MKKPLIIVEQDSEIKEMKKALDVGFEMLEERIAFIKKQQEDSWKNLVGVHWTAIEDVLRERNLLPEDYSEDKYTLAFSNGVLYLEDKNESSNHPAAKLFDMLFKE